MNNTVCRCCQSPNVYSIGRLPNVGTFAGKLLSEAIPGGTLWRCSACSFLFRDPVLSTARYDELYRQGSHDTWSTAESERYDFQLVKRMIGDGGQSVDILDVGCFTGQFLASLPSHFGKFGVEINRSAAAIASSRGVTILAESIDCLAVLKQNFDFIVACDVIEHVANPLAFLEQLLALLKPDGKIVISTGDADAWLWRIMGATFWYCYFPEHISFIGRRWLRQMPRRVGLHAKEILGFNYLHQGRFERSALLEMLKALRYFFKPRRLPVVGLTPGFGATRDHFACMLTKV